MLDKEGDGIHLTLFFVRRVIQQRLFWGHSKIHSKKTPQWGGGYPAFFRALCTKVCLNFQLENYNKSLMMLT